tara:strand:+ start:65639 stop:65746 length:108 start_codon:yes stop_codon:yes gene_type:complete
VTSGGFKNRQNELYGLGLSAQDCGHQLQTGGSEEN